MYFLNGLVFIVERLQSINRLINFSERSCIPGPEIAPLGFGGNFSEAFFIQPRGAAADANAHERGAESLVGTDADCINFNSFVPCQFNCLRQRKAAIVVFAVCQQDNNLPVGMGSVFERFERQP